LAWRDARELSATDGFRIRPEHGTDRWTEIETPADRRGIDGAALAGRPAGATAVTDRRSLRAFAEPIERVPDGWTGRHRAQ
jgi:hypothetical protein